MDKLFGTDGIRGKANKFPLDSETIWIIGRSLARHFSKTKEGTPYFVIGRDTRESGSRIENAFYSGASSSGAVCESAGVITTPGVAFLAKELGCDAGIVISASHNPFEDNGIKVFLPSGKKLSHDVEAIIEEEVRNHQVEQFSSLEIDSSKAADYQQQYLDHFKHDFGGLDLSGLKIVADCANGASSHLAPFLFEGLGASVFPINNEPDGKNINRDCGSLHLEVLQQAVKEVEADFGVAFDGDADRSLFVNEKGEIVDGDATLWIMANHLKSAGKLKENRVVATVMSNLGLELALGEQSISLVRTSVGDKYVLEELVKSHLTVGGEQSGHIIFPDRSLVGDGMQTALFLLEALAEDERSFSELIEGFERLPQILVNVRVGKKLPFENLPSVMTSVKAIEKELGERGRLLLRYSGTENLARVMIEGADQNEIELLANRLADVIKSELC
jgi:phosphoglucosamine mutase